MELETAGHRVDDVAGVLREAAARLDASHPPSSAYGAAGPGALGELGRAWATKISEALTARVDESRALAAAAAELAVATGSATAGYRDIESRRRGA